MGIDWAQFAKLVHANKRFLLTTHVRPDCDALGSCLGMAAILESIGKTVRIVNGQETPPNLAFIDPDNRIEAINVNVSVDELLADKIDVLMVLDTSAWAQLGPMGEVIRRTKAQVAVLDHHMSSDDLNAIEFRDTSAEAAGRLVIDAADALQVKLTAEMARPLFAALATDTGWFRFGSTSGNTFRYGGRLVDAGAKPSELYHELYENATLARIKLIGRILAQTESELDGKLVYTAVSLDDFAQTGAVSTDTEDVINLTLQVGTARVAMIMVEQQTGGYKVSFRSRCKVDCSVLASQFKGGGHKAAAGAFINEPFEVARAKLLSAIRAAMKEAGEV
ncbi:MAG: DHHA1 domain-containing protein [Planctomycetota bacterium]|nr:DHHA1 domain-containing protein [Planctomycetota bacterium]